MELSSLILIAVIVLVLILGIENPLQHGAAPVLIERNRKKATKTRK